MIYGIDFPIEIGYGVDNESKIQIRAADTGFFEKDEAYPQNIVWKEWDGRQIPFLFASDDADEIVNLSEGGAVINYDIISSAFYFLSGWQEHKNEKRDKFGRFPFGESIQYREKIIELPVVNYYFDILKYAVEQASDIKLNVKLWGDSNFVSFISHDIDKCQSAWKEGSYSELKRGRILSPFVLMAKKLFGNDDWFNFDKIIALEKKYGAKSTFYFLCERKKANLIPNADYDITGKKFQQVFDNILNNGSEIGIHGSIGTSNDPEKLKFEMSKINRDISGNRFHFLSYDVKHTPGVIERVGLKYDTTLGFAEHIGFRNSFCFPFFPYDIESDKPHEFLEIPLIVMDNTLDNPDYMNLSKHDALEKVQGLIREIKKFNGCFGLLWHNNFFSEYKYTGWGEVFEQILKYCSGEGAGFMTGKEISDIFVK
ncbi:polysaccharide deacetylase family protein [bacterium AH-315-M05]|nr:polysaccharide deacetylase family protein [bacterium AH-315-M05]